MVELGAILEESIQSIEETTMMFYQQKIEEGYKLLENTLTLLTNTMNCIFNYINDGNDIGVNQEKLIEVLVKAMKSIEVKDIILFSDILQYELKELFEEILKVLSL